MASQAYRNWVADGKPWEYARPVRAVGDRLAAHGYTVYFEGDLNHLTKDTPEDHCPFSATGWPAKSPYPYCMALDIMPPKQGQVSKLTGRRLPSLQQLGAKLRADRIAGHPGAAWLKYMNWEPSGDNTGNCWHETWQPGYVRAASGDRGHIHGSCRTDQYLSAAADNYDLVLRAEEDMTLFGWDLSHYDAPDSRRAVSEGFGFFTHKAGGDANDAELGSWWNLMKPYRRGVLLGAYWVLYPGNPTGRADAFVDRLDSQCPGWRDGPFILQVDCEIWGGNRATLPGLADVRAFCNRLRAVAPKLMPIVYAPKWAYGNALAGLGYPLWASSYVSGSGAASKLYPGDNAAGWGAYSGQTPLVLQFTSSATIAGQTTCDANAFRGSLAQLQAKLAPGWATEGLDDDMATEDMIDAAEAGLRRVLASGFRASTGQAPDGDAGKPDRNVRDQFRGIVGGPVDQSLLLAAIQSDGVDNEALAAAITPGLAAAVVAALPDGALTAADLEQALRNVLGSLNDQPARTLSAPSGGDDIFTQTQREIAQRRIQGSDQA